MHHQSALAIFTQDQVSRQPDISDYLETDALYVHDIQSSYNFDNGIEVYLGVNNLANREPDRTYLNTPIGGKGRYFYAGLTANFEELSNLNPFR
jgi:iron complex outermembrane receptor protein